MIINVNEQESAALTFHMATMRKPFRNLIKAKYRENKKEFLSSYDYVHSEAGKALESMQENIDSYELHLNISDLEILGEFLNAYTNKLSSEFGDRLKDTGEFYEHFKALTLLLDKCNSLLLGIK